MSLRTELFQFDNYGINSFLFNAVSSKVINIEQNINRRITCWSIAIFFSFLTNIKRIVCQGETLMRSWKWNGWEWKLKNLRFRSLISRVGFFPKYYFFPKKFYLDQIWPRDHMTSWSDWWNWMKTTKSIVKINSCHFSDWITGEIKKRIISSKPFCLWKGLERNGQEWREFKRLVKKSKEKVDTD